jgi:hypothetical protein
VNTLKIKLPGPCGWGFHDTQIHPPTWHDYNLENQRCSGLITSRKMVGGDDWTRFNNQNRWIQTIYLVVMTMMQINKETKYLPQLNKYTKWQMSKIHREKWSRILNILLTQNTFSYLQHHLYSECQNANLLHLQSWKRKVLAGLCKEYKLWTAAQTNRTWHTDYATIAMYMKYIYYYF